MVLPILPDCIANLTHSATYFHTRKIIYVALVLFVALFLKQTLAILMSSLYSSLQYCIEHTMFLQYSRIDAL